MPDPDDLLDGCDVDMADPARVTEDGEETLALVLFADLPWTGRTVTRNGREYPEVDPDALEDRMAALEALAAATDPDPTWFGAHGGGYTEGGD